MEATANDPATALRITIDDREPSGFAQAVAARWTPSAVGRLPVGDVEVGSRVLVERKTVPDFVASLEDGRLFRQAAALTRACHRPLLVVEGTEAYEVLGVAPEALRGVLLTLTVAFRLPMLRTSDAAETAECIVRIARHEARRAARLTRPRTPTPGRQALAVLASIPGVGDERARRLLNAFGSVAAVASASEQELRRVELVGEALARAIVGALGPNAARPSS
jgi:Fanconi anemia group M protein